MLDGLRRYLFGDDLPPVPSGLDGIPHENREAHHRLMNTAMKMKKVARDIDGEANDLLELLARDLGHGDAEEMEC